MPPARPGLGHAQAAGVLTCCLRGADMAGGIAAGIIAVPLYGAHAVWLDKLFPWSHHHDHNEWEADGSVKVGPQGQG